MLRSWLCLPLVAALLAGCLDFDAAERDFCASHTCTRTDPDGGVAGLDTTITTGPAPTTGPNPQFSFTSTDDAATFECQLTPTETHFTACTSPKVYSNLPAGSGYLFRVRARNAAGRVDPTPAEQTFVVVGGPSIAITAPADGSTVGKSVTLTFSPETGVTYSCQLDSTPAVAGCTSGHVFSALTSAANPHHLTLTGTDSQSRTASQTVTFTVDDTGPGVTVASNIGPSGSTTSLQTVTFTLAPVPSTEPQATFTCTLDGVAISPCTSPIVRRDLKAGAHSFIATAVDRFGNAGSPSGPYTWTIAFVSQTISYIRTHPALYPDQTLISLALSSGLKMTLKTSDRFWVQEGTSPNQGITLYPPSNLSPFSDSTLTAGRLFSKITGTLTQVNSNLALTNTTYTTTTPSTPYDAISGNRDEASLNQEINEGMFVDMGGRTVSCDSSAYDFCIESCETENPLIYAFDGLDEGSADINKYQTYRGVVEGARGGYSYFVESAEDQNDACL